MEQVSVEHYVKTNGLVGHRVIPADKAHPAVKDERVAQQPIYPAPTQRKGPGPGPNMPTNQMITGKRAAQVVSGKYGGRATRRAVQRQPAPVAAPAPQAAPQGPPPQGGLPPALMAALAAQGR